MLTPGKQSFICGCLLNFNRYMYRELILCLIPVLLFEADAELSLLKEFYDNTEQDVVSKIKRKALERDNKDIIFLFTKANSLDELHSTRFSNLNQERYKLLELFLTGVDRKRHFQFRESLCLLNKCKMQGEAILDRTEDWRFIKQIDYQIAICKSFLRISSGNNCLDLIDPVKRDLLSNYYGDYVRSIYHVIKNIHESSSNLEGVLSKIKAEKNDETRFMLEQLFLYIYGIGDVLNIGNDSEKIQRIRKHDGVCFFLANVITENKSVDYNFDAWVSNLVLLNIEARKGNEEAQQWFKYSFTYLSPRLKEELSRLLDKYVDSEFKCNLFWEN